METWAGLEPYVSAAIFAEVTDKLEKQRNDAEWWRDACVGYFQKINGRDLPSEVRPINIPVDTLMAKNLVSDRQGMPVYGDDNRVKLEKKRVFRRPGRAPGAPSRVPGNR